MLKLSEDYLKITPKLKQHWLKAINDNQEGLRVTFVRGGCSGDELRFDPIDVGHSLTDSFVLIDDSKKLFVDQKVMHVFSGGTLDLVTEGVNTIVKLDGPNLAGGCGCGQSYKLD